ncbi:MAG: hypothetical protein RIE08_07765 [Acidimicrobiales bacterium]
MKKLFLALLVLALVAAACGGDDDDSAAPFSTGDDGGSDQAAGDDGGSSDDGGSFSGDSGSDWCSLAQNVEDESFLGNDTNPFAGDASSIEEAFKTTLDFADEAEDRAPDEISDDVETLFDGLRQLDDALSDVDYNFLALDTSALASLEDPAFQEASENIQRYNFEVCGVGDGVEAGAPGDDGGTAGDDSSDDGFGDLPADGSFGDVIAQSLQQSLGLSEADAQCLVDNLDLDSIDPENLDTSALFGVFAECDIDLAQLGQ